MFNSEAWSVTAEAHILFSSLLCSVFYGISNQDQIEASSNFFLHFFENLETFSDKISKQKYWFMEERKKSQKITRYSLNCLNFFLRYQTPQSLMNFSFVWTIFLHTWFLRNDQVSSFYNSRKMRGGGGGGSTSSRSTVHCSDQKMEK